MIQVKIPFLAEGVESGVVVSILVKEGAQVKKDDTVLELETNKATAPIPSPASGIVKQILVKEGAEVSVGQAVMSLAESGEDAKAPAVQPKETKTVAAPPRQEPSSAKVPPTSEYRYESKTGLPPPASPSVRKLAQQLGIDLNRVRGSEHGGRITMDDVKGYIERLQAVASGAQQVPTQAAPPPKAPSIDFSKWGPINRRALSPLRKTIGQRMQESWSTIPHVTQFDEADITELLEMRKKYSASYEKKGAKLTVTGIILKGLVPLLKKYPRFNSSLGESSNEMVEKNYYHFGIAVDTDQGLIVPVIKDVDKKNLLQLSIELAQVAEKARQRKLAIDEMQGGTFTVSNLGSIGGAHFTPIVNRPEVAILGLGRGISKPVVKDGKIQARTVIPVCLSYDHRVIDGADGARFVQSLVQTLENFDEREFKLKSESEGKKSTGKKKR